jgi:hypothetical protein
MSVDLHIQHVIHNGIKLYKDNANDIFRDLFYDVSPALSTKWYNKMNAADIHFDKAFSRKKEKFPLITTRLVEAVDNRNKLLGNQGAQGNKTIFISAQCDIHIFADDFDFVRIISRICKASILGFKSNFLEKGYLDINFIGSQDLAPQYDLTSEDVIVYNRVISFVATQELNVQPQINPEQFGDMPWSLNPTIVGNNAI